MSKNLTKVFLISSSLPMFLATMVYLGNAYRNKNRPGEIPYEIIAIAVPLLYGIFGTINYYVISNYDRNYSLIVGAIFGLILSLFGRFVLDLPIKIFNFNKGNEYLVHVYAIVFYALLYRFLITPLAEYTIPT
jgi:hypothetical protein